MVLIHLSFPPHISVARIAIDQDANCGDSVAEDEARATGVIEEDHRGEPPIAANGSESKLSPLNRQFNL